MEKIILNLHEEAKIKAKAFRKAQVDLLDIMQRLDQHKVFMKMGYASLYDYCLKELDLAESTACLFINVMRKAREIPELKQEISQGTISVHRARKITPVLTCDNVDTWIPKAKTLTHRDLEKAVASEKPETAFPAHSHYISLDRMALQLSISEDLMDQIVQLQDILSKKKKDNLNLEETLEYAIGQTLDKIDPVQKLKRALARKKAKQDKINPETREACSEIDIKESANLPHTCRAKGWQGFEESDYEKRQYLEQRLRHEVIHRDQNRCTHVYANGQRCRNRRFLEMHHIIPVSLGGENRIENLRLLCSAHHKHVHYAMTRKPNRHRADSLQVALLKS